MSTTLTKFCFLWLPALLGWMGAPADRTAQAAEAVFSSDGQRVYRHFDEGSVSAVELAGAEAERPIAVPRDEHGEPKLIQDLALSKAGHLLLATPQAVWAFNPTTSKCVRVAATPAGFQLCTLAYQESTGAILVLGYFLRADQTTERLAGFRIAKGSDQAEPVYLGGLETAETAAFDAAGHLYLGSGPDLWAGDLVATEHEQSSDFPWQYRGFRLAALGTPVVGEGSRVSQVIATLSTGGGRLTVTMSGGEGSTLLRLPLPALSGERVITLKGRWSLQQKVTAGIEFLTKPEALPRNATVAVGLDGRVVYQTGQPGLRRWWLLGRSGPPRLLHEVAD